MSMPDVLCCRTHNLVSKVRFSKKKLLWTYQSYIQALRPNELFKLKAGGKGITIAISLNGLMTELNLFPFPSSAKIIQPVFL